MTTDKNRRMFFSASTKWSSEKWGYSSRIVSGSRLGMTELYTTDMIGKEGKIGLIRPESGAALFSSLFQSCQQRHGQQMKIEIIVEFISEVIRTLFVEESADRARRLTWKLTARPRGMQQLRKHVHRQVRRRLFDRLSTLI